MTPPALDNEQRHTLARLWSHPVPTNLKWPRVLALLRAMGEVVAERGDRYKVTVDGRTEVFRSPRRNGDVPVDEIVRLRHFLGPEPGPRRTGQGPHDEGDEGADGEGPDLVVVIDHRSATVYEFEPSTDRLATMTPYDPDGRLRHLRHVEGHDQGRQVPEPPGYYEQVAAALAGARRVVVLGHGDGNADAAARLRSELATHGAPGGQEIVEVRIDAKSFTERQLLEVAQEAVDAQEGGNIGGEG